MLLLLSADFFQIRFFKIFFQEHYQSAKLFAKGYQQMTKVAASKERVITNTQLGRFIFALIKYKCLNFSL